MPTKTLGQNANDSTSVKTAEIRTANQIFSEHSAFSKIIEEQKSFIYSLQSINAEEVLKNQRLTESLSLKDSTIYGKDRIIEIRDTDCQINIKSAKKGKTEAYIIAGIATTIAIFVLIK